MGENENPKQSKSIPLLSAYFYSVTITFCSQRKENHSHFQIYKMRSVFNFLVKRVVLLLWLLCIHVHVSKIKIAMSLEQSCQSFSRATLAVVWFWQIKVLTAKTTTFWTTFHSFRAACSLFRQIGTVPHIMLWTKDNFRRNVFFLHYNKHSPDNQLWWIAIICN